MCAKSNHKAACMNKKSDLYIPHSPMQTFLILMMTGAVIAILEYILFSNYRMISVYTFAIFIILGLIAIFDGGYKTFIIDIDHVNPETTCIEITEDRFRFKNEDGSFRDFYYKDIKEVIRADTSVVLVPRIKSAMNAWVISNDYVANSSLDQEKFYSKLGSYK